MNKEKLFLEYIKIKKDEKNRQTDEHDETSR